MTMPGDAELGLPGGSRAEAVKVLKVPQPSAQGILSMVSQVSETERLCYVGHNFGNEVMKCNSLCRYGKGAGSTGTAQTQSSCSLPCTASDISTGLWWGLEDWDRRLQLLMHTW